MVPTGLMEKLLLCSPVNKVLSQSSFLWYCYDPLCVRVVCVCVCGIGIGPASANCCRCIGQQGEISFGSLRQDLLPPSAFRSGVSIFNCRLLGLYDPRHIFFGKFSHYHNPYSHRGRHVPCEGGLPQTNFLLENLVCCFDLSEVNQK